MVEAKITSVGQYHVESPLSHARDIPFKVMEMLQFVKEMNHHVLVCATDLMVMNMYTHKGRI